MSTRTDYSEHRALIVGCGSIGKRHSRNLRSLGVREIAFFDVNCEAAQNLQAELDGKAFADYETALNIFKPNIALICTPPVWHVDHARMALESGAHTFIEKPLAHESTAIPALIELAKRDQRVVQVGYNLRFHPGLRILKELVDNQRIGRVLWLSAEAGQYLPDWRPTQNYRDSYTGRRAMGGGILLDGSHELDYVCWLLGRPTEVSCRADRTSKLEVDVEDSAWLRIEFPDRRWAGIHIDFVQRTYTRTCKVVGETGTALWDFASREVRWYCSENKKWNATSYSFDINDMYVEEIRHFLACVSSGSRPMVDLEQGEAIVRLVEAAKRSSDEKRTVQIASTPERNKKITVAIIQARMGSSRLPGKSLAEIEGKPMLWHVVRRVTLATRVDRVVVATTEARQDDAIVRMCAEHDIPCYRGSEDDVLDRFYQTATAERASQIVRITADCPLIDPEVIDLVVDKFERGVFDYVSNSMIHTFPDGLDTEVFSFEALEQAWREAHKVSEREHVTPFLRSGKFRIANVENKAEFACGTCRWTVDESRDLEFVRTVYGAFRGRDAFGMQDVLHFLRTHRECEAMNAGIVSNSGYYKSLCSDSSAESAPSRSLEKSSAWLNRAKKVIPGCSQTFSKGYNQHVKGVAPVFLESGKGCRVWDVDGNEYIDYIQGLLPNILGYANEEVNAAVSAQLSRGHSFSLPHPVEVELAERLTTLIPCAEMVRFGKNGSDATSGAVRAARAFTGKERIACCGYHGWQDWFIGSTTRNAGVPLAVRELTHNFIYNDLNSLETILEKHRNEFAAVIMEPANFTPPAAGFLEEVRNLAHKHGALLIFDEICSGFHFGLGGAQKRFGVTPDLACFGKAMGNGFPISCIVGRADVMHIFEEVFFSFTFGGEVASMAAAMTVLDILERTDAFAKIEANGRVLQEGLNTIAKEVGLQDRIKCVGYPFWSLVKFLDEKGKDSLLVRSLFAQECAKRGLLLLATHNMTAAHDAPAIEQSLKIYAATCKTVSAWLSDRQPEKYLEGDMIESVFKVR